ncbi:MAG TPA: di-heme oxidoredictase family protein, partial [Ginsengibacter sp.]|nr:di-heme oxidoredictase family protein [Ginsengibacter sp.]
YVRTLAVPARRNVTDTFVKEGEKIFAQINCSGCHKPTIYTAVDVTLPVISNQRIHPYTDLLLHDMGDELADNRPDFLATGNEWRTPPVWGGEAEQSKQKFTQLSSADRNALLQFLKSL